MPGSYVGIGRRGGPQMLVGGIPPHEGRVRRSNIPGIAAYVDVHIYAYIDVYIYRWRLGGHRLN
jgi:hypothetical protein